MTLVQIVLFSFGFILFGVAVYFHSKDKNSGSFIGIGSFIIVVAAVNPTSLLQLGIENGAPNTAVDSRVQSHTAITHTTPAKQSVKHTDLKSAVQSIETSTVEPVAKIGQKANALIKTVAMRSEQDRSAADYLLLGTEAWQEEDYSKAFQYVNHALTMQADQRVRSSLILLLGSLYEAIDNTSASEQNYKKAITVDPTYNWPYIKLGNLYTSVKRYEEAELYYKKAIDLDPMDAWTHNNLGILYSNQQRYNEAEEAYRKAIRLNPDDAWTHNNLGVLYKDLNRYEEAEQAYKQAVSLDPKHVLAHNNLNILNKIRDSKNTP